MGKYKRIYVEIINSCNLSCSFCPKTKRKIESIELDKFEHTLIQIKPHTDYIYLHVLGEPLSHPKLSEILDLCEEHKIKVNITTNGTYLSQVKDILQTKKAIRQINISLHSIEVNLNFKNKEEYIEQVISFVKEIIDKRNDINISLRLWNLDKDNQLNIEKKQNQKIIRIIEEAFELTYKIEEKITPSDSVKLTDRVFLHQDY